MLAANEPNRKRVATGSWTELGGVTYDENAIGHAAYMSNKKATAAANQAALVSTENNNTTSYTASPLMGAELPQEHPLKAPKHTTTSSTSTTTSTASKPSQSIPATAPTASSSLPESDKAPVTKKAARAQQSANNTITSSHTHTPPAPAHADATGELSTSSTLAPVADPKHLPATTNATSIADTTAAADAATAERGQYFSPTQYFNNFSLLLSGISNTVGEEPLQNEVGKEKVLNQPEEEEEEYVALTTSAPTTTSIHPKKQITRNKHLNTSTAPSTTADDNGASSSSTSNTSHSSSDNHDAKRHKKKH